MGNTEQENGAFIRKETNLCNHSEATDLNQNKRNTKDLKLNLKEQIFKFKGDAMTNLYMIVEVVASESDHYYVQCVVTSINRNLENRYSPICYMVDIKRFNFDHIIIIGKRYYFFFWAVLIEMFDWRYENLKCDEFCSTHYSFNGETFKQFGNNILVYCIIFFTIYKKLESIATKI